MIKARGLKLILQFFRLYFEKVTHTKVSRNILKLQNIDCDFNYTARYHPQSFQKSPKKGVKNRMETGIGRNPPPTKKYTEQF